MKRKPLPYLDVKWEGVFENYAKGFVRRNYWRVQHVCQTPEDALQEAACVWVRCFNHYALTVDNPAWFMSLYKFALVNEFNTLSSKDSRRREVAAALKQDAEAGGLAEPITHSDGPLAAILAGASQELKQALSIIADAPAEVLTMLLGSDSPEMTNRRLRRFCRIKGPERDLIGELRRLIS